ncbi:nucleotidyltransferase [Sulfodiicoccus acidiphilus]|uniref:Nucleotidyltransferase n=1 Tax=Sulfodiicoccus acidiphilus TaxID=1670455 RepID=A0A348B0V8_9CREN|nr:bifunctional sugar-1-phosphate nucleotidylyltransferase/acetyltransferase [Sulfodiicoccus acidiphilus]BBD71810.1 nucleotidyltransferase [Sulfodiicoccus acidiphilus]GGT99327.1 nucleotidyltransferase [Sulfodiicoccus acidiphilus]
MKAVVLAAGRGERLEPITQTRPKPLIPLMGTTLLERIVNILKRYVDQVIVIGNQELRERYFETTVIQQRPGALGTAAALSSLRLNEDSFLVVYGDLLFDEGAISKVVDAPGNTILGVKVSNPSNYGVILSSGNKLEKIIEKPQNPPSNIVNGGIYKLSSEVFSIIDKLLPSPRNELELTDAINVLASQTKVSVLIHDGMWMDVGKPWQVIEANKTVMDAELRTELKGKVHEDVKVIGKVFVEETAEVKPGTVIEGPAYIGSGAEIGPLAHIRPYTVIGRKSKVGSFVEVKETVLMEGVKLPHLNYVGDSVVCEEVNLGAGTIVANLRFDESEVKMSIKGTKVSTGRRKMGAIIGGYVKTGINVSILPGVKVGSRAIIYPGRIVNRDVESGEVYK